MRYQDEVCRATGWVTLPALLSYFLAESGIFLKLRFASEGSAMLDRYSSTLRSDWATRKNWRQGELSKCGEEG